MRTIMVVRITTPSVVLEHEGEIQKEGDMVAVFKEATHKFRLEHSDRPLMAGENEPMPEIAIRQYFKP